MKMQGYASTDTRSRLLKARKIEALLGGNLQGKRLLDLGTGSGILAEYFSKRGAVVSAADREDSKFTADFPFHLIDGTRLPLESASFDLVILNHVLEHVGDAQAQCAILNEVCRVLRDGGRLYLAVPSKWALIEPHFRLPLMGAMPRRIADWMARRFRGRSEYDCFPPSYGQLLAMMRKSFANVEDCSEEAAHWVIEHELPAAKRSMMRFLPRRILRILRPLYPTFIMIGTKIGAG